MVLPEPQAVFLWGSSKETPDEDQEDRDEADAGGKKRDEKQWKGKLKTGRSVKISGNGSRHAGLKAPLARRVPRRVNLDGLVLPGRQALQAQRRVSFTPRLIRGFRQTLSVERVAGGQQTEIRLHLHPSKIAEYFDIRHGISISPGQSA
ncbi:hypothetical protein CLAIMM_08783 [Cladophialophora immunda]|nr:hypothetical protein CLAIMM_08783 [Cladophialophora immunda]